MTAIRFISKFATRSRLSARASEGWGRKSSHDRLAIAKGSRFVRIFFLVIVVALIAKLAQSIIAP